MNEMKIHMVLIRGINVGGKNKVLMAGLRECLEQEGFSSVSTYLATGNVILKSDKNDSEIGVQIEEVLAKNFDLDDEIVRVLVLAHDMFKAVIENKPKGFGEQPKKYHSDTIFLIDLDSKQAISVFEPREGVDMVWAGDGVIYSQRLSAQLTKSRLSRIVVTPEYKLMTIRSWKTTTKLLEKADRVG